MLYQRLNPYIHLTHIIIEFLTQKGWTKIYLLLPLVTTDKRSGAL